MRPPLRMAHEQLSIARSDVPRMAVLVFATVLLLMVGIVLYAFLHV